MEEKATVRAKFKCIEVGTRDVGDGVVHTAKFSAVHSGSDENKEFWKWTPNGELTLSTIRVCPFVPGKEYFLDITEA